MNKNSREYNLIQRIGKSLKQQDIPIENVLSQVADHIRSDNPGHAQDVQNASIPLAARVQLAQESLVSVYRKHNPQIAAAGAAVAKRTQGENAEAVVEVLTKYKDLGLTEEQANQVAEVAWWSTGASDELSPDEINTKQIKSDLARQKRKKEKITPEEISAVAAEQQRGRIVSHYINLSTDKERASKVSNSEGALYALELGIHDLRMVSPDVLSEMNDIKKRQVLRYLQSKYEGIQTLDDARAKIIAGITEKAPGVGKLLMSGQGAQFFSDPSGYLVSKASKAIAAQLLKNTALQGALTAAAALTGPVGWAARAAIFLAQKVFGRILGKIIGGTVSIVRNNTKRVLGAVAGMGILAILLTGSGMAMALAIAGGASVLLVPVIALVMMIINSGAYVVPPSPDIASSSPANPLPIPPGGIVQECPDTGDITAQLASQISNGVVKLLPDTLAARSEYRACIQPTMLVMHWSGGSNDNPFGNERTYNTLINRDVQLDDGTMVKGLACQIATDMNDTWLMQPFYETLVEKAWCVGSWNVYSINNEMSGISFTGNPPPPNLSELELTYNVSCKMMEQYKIPWCQIYGHYQAPNNGGKSDPGDEFLQNVFIPGIRARCPNDTRSECPS